MPSWFLDRVSMVSFNWLGLFFLQAHRINSFTLMFTFLVFSKCYVRVLWASEFFMAVPGVLDFEHPAKWSKAASPVCGLRTPKVWTCGANNCKMGWASLELGHLFSIFVDFGNREDLKFNSPIQFKLQVRDYRLKSKIWNPCQVR